MCYLPQKTKNHISNPIRSIRSWTGLDCIQIDKKQNHTFFLLPKIYPNQTVNAPTMN